MATYNRLIKSFDFEECNRALITLDTNIRLVPDEHKVELKPGAGGYFPTTDNIKVKTWVANPTSVKGWVGFFCDIKHKKNAANVVVTSDGFRLGDGTNEFWWNGTAWAVNTVNWNTEAEIAANISTFPVAARSLQAIIKLRTSDNKLTPELRAVRVAYQTDVEFQEDLLFRTLVPTLRENLRPTTDFQLDALATGATLNLNTTYKLEAPYDVVGVAAAYNLTTDPSALVDIFQSYNAGTKVVTLAASVTAGQRVLLRLIYQPTIAVMSNPDFNEVSEVPCVLIENFMLRLNEIGAREAVVNKATATAIVIDRPYQGNAEFDLELVTDKQVEHQRLADALKRFFAKNPLIKSKALDESYTIQLLNEYQSTSAPNRSGLSTSRLRARIVGALFFVRDATDKSAVLRINRTYPPAPEF